MWCQDFGKKGIGAGVDCEQVDGNDVVAVYLRMQNALEKARMGKGPTLIEAVSYRLGDHTADDADLSSDTGWKLLGKMNRLRLRLILKRESLGSNKKMHCLPQPKKKSMRL